MKKTLLTLAACLSGISVLSAATVVDMDLDGDITTFAGNVIADNTPYSLSTAMFTASTYTSTSNTAPANNATVYGGYSGDNMQFQTILDGVWATGAGNQQVRALAAVWKKSDFLNGGAANQVNIESSSAITALIGDDGDTQPQFGWLIVKGGTTYMSGLFTLGSSDVLISTSSGDLTGLSWSSVDFATNGLFDAGSTIVDPTAAGIFTDIDGIGLITRSPDATTDTRRSYLQSFSADLAVIPEPSSFALIFGALTLGVVLCRRRRS